MDDIRPAAGAPAIAKRATRLVAAVACAAWALGCGADREAPAPLAEAVNAAVEAPAAPEPLTRPVTFDLIERFPVAAVNWLPGWKRARPSSEKRGAAIQQQQGGTVTWFFAVPQRAVLRGAATWMRGRHESSPERTVFIELESEAGDESLLLQHVFEPGASSHLELDADLSAFAGTMVSIRARIAEPRSKRRNTAPQPPALRWNSLTLEGVEPDSTAAVADVARGRRNVLLILFDTLRADRTEPYGATDVETPSMKRLAASGVTFARARSNATWTSPSVASLLTGLHVGTHGISGTGFGAADQSIARLGAKLPYLPDLLQRAGYRTHAVVTNHLIHPVFGFGRGFGEMIVELPSRGGAATEHAGPDALAEFVWREKLEPFLEGGDDPFFVYLHELDPHYPYDPPAPYDRLGAMIEGAPPEQDNGIFRRFAHDPSLLSASEIAHLEALYRGEIEFMDAYLGALLDHFNASGRLEDTIVVFVSDHGEAFNEHGGLGHSDEIYETLLRVPFLLSAPGVTRPGSVFRHPVSLVDVAPTLLDLVGVGIPDGVQGRSLVPLLLDPDAEIESRPVFARAHFPGSWHDAIVLGRWKLSQLGGPLRRTRGRETRLFDLEQDPGETENLIDEHPIVAGVLTQMLAQQNAVDSARVPTMPQVRIETLDANVQRNLEALGYFEPVEP